MSRYRDKPGGGPLRPDEMQPFPCRVCGHLITPGGGGTRHRNHCPGCLHSLHLDDVPGDRSAACGGVMEPVGVWVRRDGEWALIHRCRLAADDDPLKLMSLAVRPLARPPFPLEHMERMMEAGAEE